MEYKEFCENAEIVVSVKIYINDSEVFTGASYDINGAIDLLGKAERAELIKEELDRQYEELPEDTEL